MSKKDLKEPKTKNQIEVDTWYGNQNKVWTKYPLKDTVLNGPDLISEGNFEMIKKGIIRKNKRYF
jgi:hypothetical protein